MMRALYSAASGMTAQQLNVDNIANNLANANTAGYKTRQAQFQDLLYQSMVSPGASAGQQTTVPTGLQVGLGTRTSSNEIIFTQGNFQQTNMPATSTELAVVDPFDPDQNVAGGASLLRELLDRYSGDLNRVLGAYNAGAARVDAAGGIPAIPETTKYVQNIMGRLLMKD